MAFDKIKAMRNAERYLAQGKIRAAINEYQDVVGNDPRDYGTMNLLGDLFSKADESKAAVRCYTTVAEHYGKQGFAQKAIAVYNKISKLQPNSVGVSEKLAELYKQKGSVTEAKSHYVVLAENYQSKGRTTEALAMWKQIALLDPQNTEVYLTIAEAYLKEGEVHEAAEAFADAAERFRQLSFTLKAHDAFWTGIQTEPSNRRCLDGYVDVAFEKNEVAAAVERLNGMLEADRTLSEVRSTLVDCHIRCENAEEAESTVLKLVEQDPSQHPKLLDLANFYIYRQDLESACRILNVASEHLLQSGRAGAFADAVRVILESDPEQFDAVRLRVRFCTWQKDEAELKEALISLADLARKKDQIEDERFALSQLVLYMPQERSYAERLHELNSQNGFDETAPVTHSLFDERFFKKVSEPSSNGFAIPDANDPAFSNVEIADTSTEPIEAAIHVVNPNLTADEKLSKEADSVRFYIESGYHELAETAVSDLRAEYGQDPVIDELEAHLRRTQEGPTAAPAAEVAPTANSGKLYDLGELSKELGFEDAVTAVDGDFDTKYQTAVAYQEMGLLEQAIAEFQEAATIVGPNDGTRRFFNCANLLGHCFMESGMPKPAAKWYERALEIRDLNGDEKQALWFELGLVYEAEDNLEDAGRYFEQVYAENVDFRDVSERLKKMAVPG